jgi:hypothetical protein
MQSATKHVAQCAPRFLESQKIAEFLSGGIARRSNACAI